jgi:hypothetical protein
MPPIYKGELISLFITLFLYSFMASEIARTLPDAGTPTKWLVVSVVYIFCKQLNS